MVAGVLKCSSYCCDQAGIKYLCITVIPIAGFLLRNNRRCISNPREKFGKSCIIPRILCSKADARVTASRARDDWSEYADNCADDDIIDENADDVSLHADYSRPADIRWKLVMFKSFLVLSIKPKCQHRSSHQLWILLAAHRQSHLVSFLETVRRALV